MLKCLSTAEMESVKEYLALRHKEMPFLPFQKNLRVLIILVFSF